MFGEEDIRANQNSFHGFTTGDRKSGDSLLIDFCMHAQFGGGATS